MHKYHKLCFGVLLAVTLPTISFAEAPVVSLTSTGDSTIGGLMPPPRDAQGATPVHIQASQADDQSASVSSDNPSVSNTLSSSLRRTAASVTDNNPLIGPGSPTFSAPSQYQGLPLAQRLTRVEQQLQNLVDMNLPQQISTMQQQIQQLSGELQVQQHDIDLLNQQLRNFYQDLSDQIKSVKNMSSNPQPSGNTLNDKALDPTSDDSAPAATPTKKKIKATQSYKDAFDALTKKQYVEAAKGFKAFLQKYPDSQLAVNAHFWLGEIYVIQKQPDTAMDEFQKVINNYPKSEKVRDAQLKVAIIHASQGKSGQARKEFMTIKKRYPGSTAAQLADIQLQQL